MTSRNIRATRRHFLPPPRKKEITDSTWRDQHGTAWLFHKDLKKNNMLKNWAIFDSDQWDDNWVILYATGKEWPEPGDLITLRNPKYQTIINIVKSYPSKRVCRTFIATIQSINEI